VSVARWQVGMVFSCATCACPTGGQSHESVFVKRGLSNLRATLKETRSIGAQAVLDDLYQLAVDCAEPDWNGYGASPLNARSFRDAEALIHALPMDSAGASLGATSKGWVTLQWGRTQRWTLSLIITDDGWIHWASLFGTSRDHGTVPFQGFIPRDLVDRIQRASKP
jgi:hypothetical protein